MAGNFIRARSYVYINGNIIQAFENNTNENTIYEGHNSSMNGLTGHAHTGATGDGPKLGPSSIDLSANYTWLGTHIFTTTTYFDPGIVIGNVNAITALSPSDFCISHNALWNGTNWIAQAAVAEILCLEEVAGVGQFNFYINDGLVAATPFAPTNRLKILKNSIVAQAGVSIVVQPIQQIFLDGGFDTSIRESGPNIMAFKVGGIDSVFLSTTQLFLSSNLDLALEPGKRIYLDGGVDDYIYQPVINTIGFATLGVTRASLNGSGQWEVLSDSDRAGHFDLFAGSTGDVFRIESSADGCTSSILVVLATGNTCRTAIFNRVAPSTAINDSVFIGDSSALGSSTLNVQRLGNSPSDVSAIVVSSAENVGAGDGICIDLSVSTGGTFDYIFAFPVDAVDPTGGGGPATGRIPAKIGGVTRYLPYY